MEDKVICEKCGAEMIPLEMLDKASVKYRIEPVWPYGESYEERVAVKLKEADQKAAEGTMDYYTAEEIRDKLEDVIKNTKVFSDRAGCRQECSSIVPIRIPVHVPATMWAMSLNFIVMSNLKASPERRKNCCAARG